MHIIRFKLLCLFTVLMIATMGCGLRPKQIGANHLEPNPLWKHKFDKKVLSVYFSPSGMVTVVTESASEEQMDHIWYFNSDTGKIVWDGSMDSGSLVSDTPLPIFLLQVEDGKEDLVCKAFGGEGEMWRKRPDGEILYAAVDPFSKIVFVVTVPKPLTSNALVQEVFVRAFSIETGDGLYEISLGKIFHKYVTPDNILSFSDGIAFFVYGGTAVAFTTSSGKLIWKDNLQTHISKMQ